MLLRAISKRKLSLPLFSYNIQAGFPSPAEDHIEQTLDLNDLLVTNPPATFYLKVNGYSMKDSGILDGDILIVDRSIKAMHNAIIVAELNAEFIVRRFIVDSSGITLKTDSDTDRGLQVGKGDEYLVFGSVTGIVRKLL